ncbi:adaptor related protein complex 3 subunit delta 1 [Homo sapiens]|uniref:AP-3 complex subunit delta-1 n=1 Tax=Homo sapiens TaxID=9606 RepID=AP3D1_HUMAN|nr:AP-3 complex subunit delta-1 isoform 2 [Homo sapiens]O14617.1 RecName: Full=AP-3 complex subunit delta-1; AltName: Full=AP-3 complex subunit delta; AltName: Full=Adaptor-related protein complex 3 subunit delta-1; AltName: Full=Delta-adaptin [Homo sapiens]AAC51761.1 delta-adaptin [Homo sapiens]EAW69412.1 hCG2004350, isoform CRA_a [Homo sapiens]KAI2587774.1 adaptor related protein complex 3 subunit delta 1 [Homo sapiens]KAI4039440.1 adaptor related protein complex 3 subunit delta 1 [Homo sapi|eukprot:NP_003929.4 AP-3 complex subunit delta-1 isoform 2 [Homo sapiens]
MALKMVKGSIDRMFDKNLQDLVRGIRNHKEDEAKYISQCIDEIKQELKQDNIAVKANAVCKLTYLQMLGYDISWAAFNIIEVMSASKFTFKRIGYLAASQSFHEGTDVIMLTTNQIRKDLSSPSQYDTGVALTGLSCFVTPDLARDLANDIMTLMSHTKPYIRKKAVLIMYKVFLKYPESLRPAFPRLKEKLEDPDPGVQSAAVNVICELARRNPKNYLSLAPLFFKLMTSSTNNWVLIKIIKLFGALTPLEPRLGKKLIEPLTNLIHSTSAMSLLYECVNTVIAVLISLSSGMPNHSASIQLCVQKLRILIEDSDQNLKYLGLLAMSKILKTHPKSVQSHKDLILQCLDDKDESIRLRALDLLYGMVSKKNLMEIVKKLMTHVDKAEGTTYRDELLTKIIDICSQSNYQYITNFEWYISILVELTRLEGTRHGHLIAAQMLDVAIRVKAIRKFAVSQMSALLDSAHLLASSTQRNGICEVLYAAAWICGEFSEHLQEPHHTLEAMLRPRVTTLPGHIQAVYVQNVVKLYASILQQKEQAGEAEGAQAVTQLMVDRLPQFVQSADLEVQERASCILQLVKHIQKLQAKDVPVAEEVSALFAGELNPVAPKAQKKVPVPEGLDLDAWINEPLSDSESEDERPRAVFHEEEQRRPKHRPSEADEEELARRREARKQEQANNPFYIKSSPSPQKRYQDTPGVEHIPVVQIDLSVPLKVPGLPMSDQYVKLEEERRHRQKLEKDKRRKKRKEKEKKGKRRHSSLPTESDEDIAPAQQVDIVTEEMPENALPSDEDDKDPNDPYRALDIDLDKPLADSEKLPIQKHRNTETSKSPEKDVPMVEKKSKKPKKKEKKHKEKERDKEKKKEKEKKKSPKPKKKKHRKEKEERTKGKKKSKKQPPGSEEAAGEPVQNGAPEEEQLPPESSYSLLAENSYVKMTCDIRGSLQEDSQVTVAIVLENRSSSILKGMELSVLDSLNARMARPQGSSVHDGVPVPFQLPPGVSNEAQYVFTIQSIVMAQKLKGTLSFIAKNDEGATHEKLDFRLHFSCSSYLITTPCYSDAFAKLLESGDLSMSSIKVDGIRMSFQNLLAKICFHHHFSVVERVDSCASMYSRSIQGHHVCLLVKKGENSVSVDGKCSDSTLLSNLLEEMKATLAKC